jgi:hypothetical protein
MCAVLEAIEKGFMFVGGAELATEVPYGIIIFQRQAAQEVIQFFEGVTDLRWVGFEGFCVGLIQLIQDCFAIAVAGIKGMGFYVCFQSLGNVIHVGTSVSFVI